jgi:hypothetical protein
LGIIKTLVSGRRHAERIPGGRPTTAVQKEAASPGRELVS